jgi:hypothetical protein
MLTINYYHYIIKLNGTTGRPLSTSETFGQLLCCFIRVQERVMNFIPLGPLAELVCNPAQQNTLNSKVGYIFP